MTSPATRERTHRPGHASGPGGGPQGVSKIKALVLIVVAVVLGVVLLRADRGPSQLATAGASSSTSTTAPPTTTTTVPAVKPSAAVKVLVANGGTVNGAATFFTDKLGTLGWGTLAPTTTTTAVGASAVYYTNGQQGAAAAIAHELSLAASVVQPLSSAVPVSGTTAASVVLVVGPDLAPQVTAGGS